MIAKIRNLIQESIDTTKEFLSEERLKMVWKLSDMMIDSIRSGGKVMICGNGGSAADSLHFAAELLGRFQTDRPALAAMALNADVSTLTAVSNDMGFEHVYSRQIDALGCKDDILAVLSTSGNSPNLVHAVESARKKGIPVVGLLGRDGGRLKGMLDASVVVSAKKSARIQEVHSIVIHVICEIIEDFFYERKA